jgi:hypothetical protein
MAEMLAADYASIDEDLVATMQLTGGDMQHDNHQLYDILLGLFQDGAVAPFMQPHNRTRNGRAAYRAVKAQAEGQAALMSCKAKAYVMIATARYTGKSRYSLDSYIARHQKAHNELFTLGKVLSESKKVQDFLHGIEDSSFATFKGIVLGDNTKLENFELCQQYLKTCSNVLQTAQASRNKWTVASTASSKPKFGKKGTKGSSTGPQEPPHYGHYTNEEHRALTANQRMKLKQHHEKNGGGKGKPQGKCKAAAAAVTSIASEEDESEANDPAPPCKAKKVCISGTTKVKKVKAVMTDRPNDKNTQKNTMRAQFGHSSTSKMNGEEKESNEED